MSLHHFNLKTVLTNYNAKHHTNFSPEESFGLACLSKNAREKLEKAIAMLHNAHHLFLFTEQEHAGISERKQALLRMKSKLADEHYHYQSYQDSNDSKSQVQPKFKLFQWQKMQVESLSLHGSWLQFTSAIHPKALEQLKTDWQKHAKFARLNNQALHYLSQNLLPYLMYQHMLIAKQLAKKPRSMPDDVYKQYQQHIHNFCMQAKQERLILAYAMLARLQALDDSHFLSSNVTARLHHKLGSQDVMANNLELLHKAEDFQAEHFRFYHHYIQDYGDEGAKQQLQQLSWFKNNRHFAMTTHQNFEGLWLVPQRLKGFVPTRKRWPNWLFGFMNSRLEFLATKQYFLASVQRIADVSQLPSNAYDLQPISKAIQSLQAKEKLLEEEMLSTKQHMSGYFSRSFYQTWQASLQDLRKQILKEKIKCAQHLATTLKMDFETPLIAASLAEPLCELLQALLLELSSQKCSGLLEDRVWKALEDTKETLQDVLTYHRLLKILKQMAENKLPRETDINYFFQALTTIAQSDNSQIEMFKTLYKDTINNVFAAMKTLLKCNPLKTVPHQELANYALKLIHFGRSINFLADEKLTLKLERYLKKFLLEVLKTIIKYKDSAVFFERNREALECYEKVLQMLGKEIIVADKTIAEHITLLQEKRKQHSLLVLQVKCRALMECLAKELLEKRFSKDMLCFAKNAEDVMTKEMQALNDPACMQPIVDLQQQVKLKQVSETQLQEAREVHKHLTTPSLHYSADLILLAGEHHLAWAKLQKVNHYIDQYAIMRSARCSAQSVFDEYRHFNTNSTGTNVFSKTYLNPALLSTALSNSN